MKDGVTVRIHISVQAMAVSVQKFIFSVHKPLLEAIWMTFANSTKPGVYVLLKPLALKASDESTSC